MRSSPTCSTIPIGRDGVELLADELAVIGQPQGPHAVGHAGLLSDDLAAELDLLL